MTQTAELESRITVLEDMVFGLAAYIAINQNMPEAHFGDEVTREHARLAVEYEKQKRFPQGPRRDLDTEWFRDMVHNIKMSAQVPPTQGWR